MWQAISHLLREQLGEGEIELRNELPGGEIHAAWHLRYAGRELFVKCDERELLPSSLRKPTSWSFSPAAKR
jgi:fructosamine-3-kinase